GPRCEAPQQAGRNELFVKRRAGQLQRVEPGPARGATDRLDAGVLVEADGVDPRHGKMVRGSQRSSQRLVFRHGCLDRGARLLPRPRRPGWPGLNNVKPRRSARGWGVAPGALALLASKQWHTAADGRETREARAPCRGFLTSAPATRSG